MPSPRILAIDQGTTSTRAVMFDANAMPLATAQRQLPQIYPRDGWVEHDPEAIWEAVLICCREVIAATGGADNIAAIGITNQRETTVVWNRGTGQAVTNAIVWQDRRGAAYCRKLKADGLESLIQARTGLLADSYFSATKVSWVLENVSGARAAAEKSQLAFGTIDAFLLWRLTGGRVHATDATNASRTMLYDIHKNVWDTELLALFKIPAGVLPDVRDTAGDFGATDAALFGRAIPITALVGDQQGAMVGQACFAPGMIKSTYGTGCFMLANTGERALSSTHRLLTTIAYRLEGRTTYALEGSIFNAGTVIQWLRDEVHMIANAGESEELAAELDAQGGAGRVYFVPAFTGLGAPWWDPEARAAIFGLARDTGRGHIVRAALESVCYQTQDLLTAFAADGMTAPASAAGLSDGAPSRPAANAAGFSDGAPSRPVALRVDGGMTANAWLLQFLSDITNLPVERPVYGETTVLGAALLAGFGAGLYPSLAAIAAAWRLDRRAVPNMAPGQRDARLAGWHDAVARVRATAGAV